MELIIKQKNKEYTVLYDDADHLIVNKYKWRICGKYIITSIKQEDGKYKTALMHRIIMNCPENKVIDHINHNGLDNRKINLRICTYSENNRNIKHGRGKSKYIGVYWCNVRERWVSHIQVNGKRYIAGRFKSEEEAAIKRDILSLKYFGEFASLNILTH